MLSYRHTFHAGNYADVLKHIVLVEILAYLVKKDTPFDYIDTHAGAGLYHLDSAQAQKTREYENGIGRLQRADWPELNRYLDVIAKFNPDKLLQIYPGSPKIAREFLRKQDRGWLYELHTTDLASLQQVFAHDRQVRVSDSDGYQGLVGLLPPQSKRALVLIDPSYEIKDDYNQVITVLDKAYRRFASGIYMIWYPVIERRRIAKMEKALIKSGITRIQLFELGQQSLSSTARMHAAGVIVVNPPWPLFDRMKMILPKLAQAMLIAGKPHYRCEELVGEQSESTSP